MVPKALAPADKDVPLLEIHNATIWRGGTRVFNRFSLEIGQHEQVAILGRNGAGKTTLLKLINRELYPVAAADSWVRILGRSNWNVWELRSRIGIVSQDLQARYHDTATGLEAVLSGYVSSIGLKGIPAGTVNDEQECAGLRIMKELGVAHLAATQLRQMSTGEQRRCLLGRALVHQPDALILDEPTAGLDMAASFDYLGRIRQFVAEGRSIVLVTHLLNEIPPEVERVILLRDGVIVADGRKDEVLTIENLEESYGTRLRISKVDDYWLAYPPASRPP
jgi:iron complex transport system ATP-binding protein